MRGIRKEGKELVKSLVKKENKWRGRECLNMIASENVMSPLAENLFISDFEGRYNEHEGKDAYYSGTKFSMKIERYCNDLFRNRFDTENIDCRPISGAVANLCAYKAFLSPGNTLVGPSLVNGGHTSSQEFGMVGIRGARVVDMIFDEERMQVDVEETVKVINEVEPEMVLFGRSLFLFPEPVKEISERVNRGIRIMYDAAHVLGLIYSGEFQDPLEEGADIMTASTHKTFPGPQGGIIVGNPDLDKGVWKKTRKAVFPGVMSNHHIHRLPSLAITALEMNKFGEDYADQILKNAQRLGEELHKRGFRVLCPERGFTKSHQIAVDMRAHGGGTKTAKRLEENNIIVNKNTLPVDKGGSVKNPSGIRIGVQELTRWGLKEEDMVQVADFFDRVLNNRENVKEEVREFREQYLVKQYCF